MSTPARSRGGARSDPAVAALEVSLRELADYSHACALVSWDQETNMPPAAAEARARMLATLRVARHGLLVADELGDRIAAVSVRTDDEATQASLRVLSRDRERALSQPPELVRRLAIAEARGLNAWRDARIRRDFGLFHPFLHEMIELKREQADRIGHDGERYDALMDAYEPGMQTARIEPLFGALRSDLGELLDAVTAARQPPRPAFSGRSFPDHAQWTFTMRLLRDLGFDLRAGRQDRSAHPFTTTIALRDVRVTTRIHEREPFSAVFSTIHEAGHGLYEQGFDPAFEDWPVAEAPSLGLHESQSRLWENILGRGRPFWERYTPIMREHFPEQLAGVGADDVYRHVNRVERSLIRVEADEVTYNLHILIRFRLELALMRGELEAAELPGAWNAAYERDLGIVPPDDGAGVLQDIHWSMGDFGYFPTYTLGTLYSVILWNRMLEDIPDVDDRVRGGDLAAVLDWMRLHVHRRGRLLDAEDLVRSITGHGLAHAPFLDYLWAKFGPLYEVVRR